MSFMQQQITHFGPQVRVETLDGTWFIPGDVFKPETLHTINCAKRTEAIKAMIQPYIEPSLKQIVSVDVLYGRLGRMSAPGYLDSTDWSFGVTKDDLKADLDQMYGPEILE